MRPQFKFDTCLYIAEHFPVSKYKPVCRCVCVSRITAEEAV
jgi:hypothetical protein